MSERKHIHDWQEVSRHTDVRAGRWRTIIFYKCGGCGITRREEQ